jgi:hypothetical protein
MKYDIKLLMVLCLFLSCITACKKSTTVSGIITDVLSGLPLEGVTVSIEYSALKNGQNDIIATATQVTSADGRYLLELVGAKNADLDMRIKKEGYVAFFPKRLNSSGVQDVNIKLRPKCCEVVLTIFNSKNYPLKFYSYMQGKFFGEAEKSVYSQPDPLEINANSSLTYTYVVPDSLNYLYYDTSGYKNVSPSIILSIPYTITEFELRY